MKYFSLGKGIYLALFIALTVLSTSCGKPLSSPLGDDRDGFTARLHLPGHSSPTEVTYEVVGGQAIFEGDIILGTVDANGNLHSPYEVSELGAQGVAIEGDRDYRWPNGVVPFIINTAPFGGVTATGQANIRSAIQHWEDNTDIDFVEITSAQITPQTDYVAFVRGSESNACSSPVGRIGGRQTIELTSNGNCSVGSLIHEIGHAIGLWHEHTRENRDSKVTILLDNIQVGKEGNFTKHVSDGFDIGAYDYGSIMHYGANAFCKKNTSGACVGPTIQTKPEGITIGQRTGLSSGDIAAANRLYPFFTALRHDFFCLGNEICKTGDVNGDGRADLITFVRGDSSLGTLQGDVFVAFSNGSGFGPSLKMHDWFCIGFEVCDTADFNGDGRSDLVTFVKDSAGQGIAKGDVYVAFSTGSGFGPGTKLHDWFCIGVEVCDTGDVNGDGRDDLITFVRGGSSFGAAQGDVYVAHSNGTGFGQGVKLHDWFCIALEVCKTGDVNGDGRDDLIAFVRDTWGLGTARGDVYVALANGTGFDAAKKVHEWFCIGSEVCETADVNGDNKEDLIAFVRDTSGLGIGRGDVYLAFSRTLLLNRGFTAGQKYHEFFCIGSEVCGTGDFDGNGKDDLVTFVRDSAGTGTPRGDVYTALSRIARPPLF